MPNEKPGRFDAIASEVFGAELGPSHEAVPSEAAAAMAGGAGSDFKALVAKKNNVFKMMYDMASPGGGYTSSDLVLALSNMPPDGTNEISYTGYVRVPVARSRDGFSINGALRASNISNISNRKRVRIPTLSLSNPYENVDPDELIKRTAEKFREVLELEPFAEFVTRRYMENSQNPEIRPNQLFRQTGRTWKHVVETLARAWLDDVRVVLVGACSEGHAITVKSYVLEWAAILAERETKLRALRGLRCEDLHPTVVRGYMNTKRRPGEWLHVDHSFYDTPAASLTGRTTTP